MFYERLLCHLGCLPVIQIPVLCLPSGIPKWCKLLRYRVWTLRTFSASELLTSSLSEGSVETGISEHVPFPDTQHCSFHVCIFDWSIRRLLCQWIQKSFQNQGFCKHHSWTWRDNGQIWLSVFDGNFRACVHHKFHKGSESQQSAAAAVGASTRTAVKYL